MKTKSNSHKPYVFIAMLIVLLVGTGTLNAQCPTVDNPNQSFCDVQSLLVSDLQATDNGGGIVWYDTPTSTTPLPSGFPLTNGEDYYADDLAGSCTTRPVVTVTIVGPPVGQNFQGFCIEDPTSLTLANLTAVGNNVQWYSSPSGGTPLPITTQLNDGTTYYADQENADTGCRTSRLAVLVSVGIAATPEGDAIQEFCFSDTNVPTVADLVATGNNNWYPTPFSALPYPPSTPLVNNQVYYGTTISPPCESPGRLPVLAIVVESSSAGDNGSLEICNIDAPVNLFNSLEGNPDPGGIWTPTLASGTGVFDPAIDTPGIYTYTVMGTDPCPDESAQVDVTVITQPDAGTNGILDLCSNDTNTYNLFNSLEGTPEPGGSWTPALASGTGIFDPTLDAPGVYTYTVGEDFPCPNSATVTVQFTTAPNPGTDGSIELCSTDAPVDLFNSLGDSPDTGGTWSPAFASGTGIFNPAVDAPGIYTYTLAGTDPCPDDSSQVSVSVSPAANAGDDSSINLCTSESPIDLFTVLGGTPDLGGTWSPALASGTGVFDPALDTSGIYTYTVTGTAPCSDASAEVTVNLSEAVYAGEDASTTICALEAPVDLFNILGGLPDPGGTWTPALASGSGVFDPTIDAPGIYSYTVTGAAPCKDDIALVEVIIESEANAGDDSSVDLCTSSDPIDLFTILGGTPDTGGTWSPTLASGTGVFDPAVDAPGIYTYSVGILCTDSAEVTVNTTDAANAGDDGLLEVCDINTTYNLFDFLGGSPDAGGSWSPAFASGTGVFDPAIDPPGIYTYTVLGSAPCPNDSAEVTVRFAIPPNAGEDGALDICVNGSPIDLFSVLGGTPDNGGVWTPALASGTGVFDPAVDAPGIYTYTVGPNSCGISDSAEVVVNFSPLPDAGEDNTIDICSLDNPIDLFNVLGGSPDTGGTWTPSLSSEAGVYDPAVDAPGIYTYTVGPDACGLSDSAEVTVRLTETPDISGLTISLDPDICLGESVFVTLDNALNLADGNYLIAYTISGANNFSESLILNFSNGSSIIEISSDQLPNTGINSFILTGFYSENAVCTGDISPISPVDFNIENVDTPTLSDTSIDLCAEDNPTVSDLNSLVTNNVTVVWFYSEFDTEAIEEDTSLENGVTYYAAGVSDIGCESLDRASVLVNMSICDLQSIIPDGFSPNGDTINDTFTIPGLRTYFPNFKLQVYNRYGALVYQGNTDSNDWNGTNVKGSGSGVLPVGVYFYILEINDGELAPIQGRVYLNR